MVFQDEIVRNAEFLDCSFAHALFRDIRLPPGNPFGGRGMGDIFSVQEHIPLADRPEPTQTFSQLSLTVAGYSR